MSSSSFFCKVLHADDWLFPECLERMVELAHSRPSVGLVSSYCLVGPRVCLDGLSYPSTHVSARDVCRQTLIGGVYVFGSPTSHLIRSEFIRRRSDFYDEVTFPRH